MSKWISVKDELPDSFKIVLYLSSCKYCHSKNKVIGMGFYTRMNKEWFECSSQFQENGCKQISAKVTHWMLLPELPEEQINERD